MGYSYKLMPSQVRLYPLACQWIIYGMLGVLAARSLDHLFVEMDWQSGKIPEAVLVRVGSGLLK